MLMKKLAILFIIPILALMSCNQTGIIVTDTPIKTNILGVELCKKMTSKEVNDALMESTDKFFVSMPQMDGDLKFYRSIPMGMNFMYGSLTWSYIDIGVTQEKEVYSIGLKGSYESIENAKQQFNSAVKLFTQKYGEGNTTEDDTVFWTDNVNYIGLRYYEFSSLDGSDRSFCDLYYTNIALENMVNNDTQLDI